MLLSFNFILPLTVIKKSNFLSLRLGILKQDKIVFYILNNSLIKMSKFSDKMIFQHKDIYVEYLCKLFLTKLTPTRKDNISRLIMQGRKVTID